jgi:hypothetical protein
MCQEAMQTVLSRASSEPWFLKEMFRDPEKAFRKYYLTLEEKKVLLSGCIREIETYAGKNVEPSLRNKFEEAMRFSRNYSVYFAQQEEKADEDISMVRLELMAAQTKA